MLILIFVVHFRLRSACTPSPSTFPMLTWCRGIIFGQVGAFNIAPSSCQRLSLIAASWDCHTNSVCLTSSFQFTKQRRLWVLFIFCILIPSLTLNLLWRIYEMFLALLNGQWMKLLACFVQHWTGVNSGWYSETLDPGSILCNSLYFLSGQSMIVDRSELFIVFFWARV